MFSESIENFKLSVRINDCHHNNKYYDRYNKSVEIVPGENRILIPVSEIRNGPCSRKMDTRNIATTILFITDNNSFQTIYLDDIELKK